MFQRVAPVLAIAALSIAAMAIRFIKSGDLSVTGRGRSSVAGEDGLPSIGTRSFVPGPSRIRQHSSHLQSAYHGNVRGNSGDVFFASRELTAHARDLRLIRNGIRELSLPSIKTNLRCPKT
jgi:hypothetical protein